MKRVLEMKLSTKSISSAFWQPKQKEVEGSWVYLIRSPPIPYIALFLALRVFGEIVWLCPWVKSWRGCIPVNEEVKAEFLMTCVQTQIPGLSPAVQCHMGALKRPIPQSSHSMLFHILPLLSGYGKHHMWYFYPLGCHFFLSVSKWNSLILLGLPQMCFPLETTPDIYLSLTYQALLLSLLYTSPFF